MVDYVNSQKSEINDKSQQLRFEANIQKEANLSLQNENGNIKQQLDRFKKLINM